MFVGLVFAAILGAMGLLEVCKLNRAHSTFENYYAFRGCKRLLTKTSESGSCITKSGQTIKIVMFNSRWYLDGDLPCGFMCF